MGPGTKLRNLKLVPAGENPYKVDSKLIKARGKLLQRYMKDEQKELQALYALQTLMVQMEQPASELENLSFPPGCERHTRKLTYSFWFPPPRPPQICCACFSTRCTTRT